MPTLPWMLGSISGRGEGPVEPEGVEPAEVPIEPVESTGVVVDVLSWLKAVNAINAPRPHAMDR
jgi:hypothetical protein